MKQYIAYCIIVLTGYFTAPALSAQTDTSKAVRYMQQTIDLLSSQWLTIGGKNGAFEWGPITQAVSYNDMEGLRLKVGGNTTLRLDKHCIIGGYIAYGWKDQQFKYRGNLLYSLSPQNKYIHNFPKRLFSLSYIHDLNIPGQNLETSRRDEFIQSLVHSGACNMSLQNLAMIGYEQEFKNHFSFQVCGKHLYDQPLGNVQYLQWIRPVLTSLPVRSITISELGISLRYAPREIFLQKRDNRICLRPGDIELNIHHRIGMKGVLGSDYEYQITDASIGKRFYFPHNSGFTNLQLSAGKVWSRVPFPLLFIPAGNQSYIFEENDYNGMQFYEFTTDRFVAGKVDCRFNWSPFHLLYDSEIRTTWGIKAIYGPLSDHNNPVLHSGLFLLNHGVQALGKIPYAEMHIGLDNILNLLRVEWVQRLTHSGKGAIFFSSRIAF